MPSTITLFRKLGNVKLEKLTMLQIQQFYNELLKSGRVQKKKPAGAERTWAQPTHGAMRTRGTQQSVGACGGGKADFSKSCEELQNSEEHSQGNETFCRKRRSGPYLSTAKEHGILAPMYLELTTGLRRGELLALRWEDLDVRNHTLSIKKSVARQDGKTGHQHAKNAEFHPNGVAPS